MAIRRTSPLLFAALAAALTGCTAESGILRSPGGPETALRLSVRDRDTLKPIAGAAIAAETASRHHPFSAASILGQTDAQSSRARTDDHGRATVQTLEGREFRIVVWAPGRPPTVFSTAMLHAANGDWIDPEIPAGVQVRIESAAGAPP